jgi:hypothetical protein
MRKKLLIICGVLLVLLLAATMITKLTTTTDRKVADKFVSYILENKATESYELFSTTAQKSQNVGAWKTTVSQLSIFFKDVQPQYQTTVVGTDKNTLIYSLSGKAGSYQFTVVTDKTDGKWKVFSFLSKKVPPAPKNVQPGASSKTSASETAQ